ncbi:hypothetical protein AAC387_Pa05g2424 [Persea americana]
MGGGHGQTARMPGEKKTAKQKEKAVKGSQLKTKKKATPIKCKVCMQTFSGATSEIKCKEHAKAKHPKNYLYQCFPHLK